MGLIDDDNSLNIPVRVDCHVYSLEEARKIASEHLIKFSPEENKRVIDAIVSATNKAAESFRALAVAFRKVSIAAKNTCQIKPKRKRHAHFKPHLRRRLKAINRGRR